MISQLHRKYDPNTIELQATSFGLNHMHRNEKAPPRELKTKQAGDCRLTLA